MPNHSPTAPGSSPGPSTPKLSPALARLQQQMEAQREQTAGLVQREFEKLESDLKRSAANALRTTESAITQQAQDFQTRLRRLWRLNAAAMVLMPLLTLAAFSLGAWALMHYQSRQVLTLQSEIRSLEQAADVRVVQTENGPVLVLPPHITAPWSCYQGANQCIELAARK